MSHGRTDEENELGSAATHKRRSQEHYEMLYQGRSFSGHERNCCFLNTMASGSGSDRFATISAISGLDFDDDGRGLSMVDWDHDGDLDVWITNRTAPRVRFFRNDSESDNRSVQFLLRGNGTDTNRSAVGARLTVDFKTADGTAKQLSKTLRAGEGFVSQSTLWLHFGLGPEAVIESVRVRWPDQSGTVETFAGVQVDARWILEQGTGTARSTEQRTEALALQPSTLVAPPDDRVHRIPLIYPMDVPPLGLFTFDGKPKEIALGQDQATLINLWSATCKPCLQELKAFAARADELREAGVRVVPISVDVLQSGEEEGTRMARDMAAQLKLPFDVGLAPPAVLEDLRLLHDVIITLDRPLPMPSSFLINRQGQLEVIYKGPVEVDTLLADATPRNRTPLERFERAAVYPGRVVDPQRIETMVENQFAMLHYMRAKQLFENNMFDAAAKEYEIVLSRWPDSGSIVNDSAVLAMMKGDFETAEEKLRRAMQLKPSDAEIRFNLARTLQKQGRDDEAVTVLRQTTEQFPDHANSHFLLGVMYSRQSQFEHAQAALEKAIAQDPYHDQALFALANIAIGRDEFDVAKSYLNRARNITPDQPVVMLTLAKVHVLEQNWPEAEKVLRILVQLQPQLADAHFQLGMALMSQNKFSEAQHSFARTLQLNRNYPGALEAQRKTLANLSQR